MVSKEDGKEDLAVFDRRYASGRALLGGRKSRKNLEMRLSKQDQKFGVEKKKVIVGGWGHFLN